MGARRHPGEPNSLQATGGVAFSHAVNPMALWEPSQNGLFLVAPQRHKATTSLPGGMGNGLPSASTTCTVAGITSGPLSRHLIVKGCDMIITPFFSTN